MTTFFLVRHAVTPETGKRLTGWSGGIHLSEEGRRQAEGVADSLANVPFAAVYSSPIDRTKETAHAIAARHGLKIRTLRSLGEVYFGDWTGKPLRSLARTKLWGSVQRFPSGTRFPGGETLRETQARAVAELERLRTEHPKANVCIVSHGDVIRLIAAHYLGIHIDLFQRIAVFPASTTVIGVGDGGPIVIAVNVPLDRFGATT